MHYRTVAWNDIRRAYPHIASLGCGHCVALVIDDARRWHIEGRDFDDRGPVSRTPTRDHCFLYSARASNLCHAARPLRSSGPASALVSVVECARVLEHADVRIRMPWRHTLRAHALRESSARSHGRRCSRSSRTGRYRPCGGRSRSCRSASGRSLASTRRACRARPPSRS